MPLRLPHALASDRTTPRAADAAACSRPRRRTVGQYSGLEYGPAPGFSLVRRDARASRLFEKPGTAVVGRDLSRFRRAAGRRYDQMYPTFRGRFMSKPVVCAVLAGCLAFATLGAFGQIGRVVGSNAEAAAEPVCATSAWQGIDEGAEGPTSRTVDYANATYRIENEEVTLSRGTRSEPVAPGAATQRVTRLSGHPGCGRLGKKTAVAVFIADDPGGGGTFFYVGVALAGGPAINAVFLGDRIEPQSIAFRGNGIVVTYLDRKPSDPMAVKPTLTRRLMLRFDVAASRLTELKPIAVTREPGRSDD
jgi:hypothetical protein